jgi:flagellar motor switch protein FliG
MSNIGKSVVITTYGHSNVIDKIAVSLFDKDKTSASYYDKSDEANAKNYCDTLNRLKLEGESWVFARIVSENSPYSLNSFLPLKFDMVQELDNKAIQKVLREIDSQELAKALRGEKEAVKEKIFKNMSERAAQMVKDDIEYMKKMGPISINDVKESQERIMSIIFHLADIGEIYIPRLKGDAIA